MYALLETPGSPELKSKLFLTDDPALVILYSQLRQKTLQTLRGASKITPKVEWEFVLHSARLYDRMGCDLLGLDLGVLSLLPWSCLIFCIVTDTRLVRNWEFLKPTATIAPGLGGEIDPLKLLKRRSSLVVADLPVSAVAQQMPSDIKSKTQRQQQSPTVFEEPDANSLLDSFGF